MSAFLSTLPEAPGCHSDSDHFAPSCGCFWSLEQLIGRNQRNFGPTKALSDTILMLGPRGHCESLHAKLRWDSVDWELHKQANIELRPRGRNHNRSKHRADLPWTWYPTCGKASSGRGASNGISAPVNTASCNEKPFKLSTNHFSSYVSCCMYNMGGPIQTRTLTTFNRSALALGCNVWSFVGSKSKLSLNELFVRWKLPASTIGFTCHPREWLKVWNHRTIDNNQQNQHPQNLQQNVRH